MFLYELAVDERSQRQGAGKALVAALRDLAHERGCYGMWVLTDDDNEAALATYTSAGGSRSEQVMLDWEWGRQG
jgi:ribosomal protein S18 acetylase RimI-like enzyme